MKKIRPLFMAIAVVVLIFVVQALPILVNAAYLYGDYTFVISESYELATIVEYTGSGGDVTIPSTIDASVGQYRYYSVNSIAASAFENCIGLTSVTIPPGIRSIGYSAFKNCANLTSVTNLDCANVIGDSAFENCSRLTSASIGKYVTTIGDSTFKNCTNLTSADIGNCVTTIGSSAFENCTSLTSITIPAFVATIDASAFKNCDALTSVIIPNSVTTIAYSAFDNCDSLTGIWVDEDNPSYSSDSRGVLFDKNKTTLIQAPGGITGTYTVPDSVTTISASAFENCDALTSVIIPNSVTTIAHSAFDNCDSLTGIWVDEDNPSYSSDNQGVLFDKNKTTLVRVPSGISGAYTISCDVTTIGDWAFDNCSRLTSVTISDSVITIGIWAFKNCDNLTSITIPDSVTSIDHNAFNGCANLASIIIPYSVTSIGHNVFAGCSSLNSITIPFVGQNQTDRPYFGYIFGQSSYPGGVKTCQSGNGDPRFTYYIPSSLKSITVTGGKISDRAFKNCSNLTSVIIGNGVTSIGDAVFSGCTNLTSVIYCGTQEQWDVISIDAQNTSLANASLQFHNDANGVCTICKGKILYAVIFKDWTGAVLSTKNYYLGDKVSVPVDPTKASDNTYTYTFAGWDKTVVACAGNATYTATYAASYIDYTVIFKDWDGTVLSTSTYHWGDKVTAPANPNRDADNAGTYVFDGWDKSVVNCAGDATYTATYIVNDINYVIVFKDWDGTELSYETYHWGEEVFARVIPTRDPDNTYTYTFVGWDKEIVNCAGDATYTAVYEATYIDYTVVFKDWDGTILSSKTYHCGDAVTIPVNPTRAADDTYTYTFAGWNYDVVNCEGSTTYIATYTSTYIDYTVVFKDWDGTVISSDTYHCGDAVTIPVNPTRAADDTYTYTFAGWNYDVVNCEGSATYIATYTPTYIDYMVVFKDWNGTILSSNTYHCGDNVTIPAKPTRPADNTYTYTFAGWDDYVSACTGNATYTATYTSTYINYRVVFKNWNGKTISDRTYHWGDTITVPGNPAKEADDTYTYTFAGWDKEIVTSCAGDATYSATFTPVYIDYTVEFKDWDGTVISTNIYHYGDVITIPANPTKEGNHEETYTFTGWDNDFVFVDRDNDEVIVCAGNAVYTATYTSDYVVYTIVFKDWNGAVISTNTYWWGELIAIPANPTKAADDTYAYTFAGWDTTVVNCAGDATYTATYTATYIDYTVEFKDWNGTVISTKTYHWGEAVTAPANPVRPDDSDYTYTFTGWDNPIVPCKGNAVYRAVYSSKSRVPSTITSPNYTISSGTISNISIDTTVSALVGKLNEKEYVKVYNGNQEVSGSSLIGTGMVVKIMDGSTVKASYAIVVTGDTNGDGKITVTDMLAIKAHVLKKSTLVGATAEAADTSGDNAISITDFIQVKAHILGKSTVAPRSTASQVSAVSVTPAMQPALYVPETTVANETYTVTYAQVPEKVVLVSEQKERIA